ncbi:MAG: HTH domain-containing protein [Haloarculaceae archaeon]
MSQTTCGTRARLHVRETLPTPVRGRRERVTDRLSALVADGSLAEFDVVPWDKRIPCDGSGDPETRDAYLAFSGWADSEDVSLSPFFETRECYSWETGERGTWVVLPALCLSVYEGDDLAAVYPHRDGDSYESVWTGIESLDDGENRNDRDHAADRDTVVVGPTR